MRALFIILTTCVIAAIVVQDFTPVLPLGLFNSNQEQYALLALLCLVIAATALVVQAVDLFAHRLSRAAALVRGVWVFVIILEMLVAVGDRVLITGNPAGRLGQYVEERLDNGGRVIMKKPYDDAAPLECPQAEEGFNLLFLGDSYTEGSGRAPACNYPDVVESVLRQRWRGDAHVVNAGVSGYGPADAVNLLRWYRQRRCRVDAVVYNLFLENDLTDNLPGTERRVIAGIIFRLPRSRFLRMFHPLNTRAFHWGLVVFHMARVQADARDAVVRPVGECDPNPEHLEDVTPFLRATVDARIARSHDVYACARCQKELTVALEEMRALAVEMDVPFILVVFPDRVIVDEELRQLLGVDDAAIAPVEANRARVLVSQAATPVIDLSEVLAGHAGLYRRVDTHLSDLGNIIAGTYVGVELIDALAQGKE